MANNNGKLLKGCDTPSDASLKQTYERLVQIFAPVVYFDPAERFFPVDLPSAVKASALYRVDGTPEKATAVKNYGSIVANDLLAAEKNFFTTVIGWTTQATKIENEPDVPSPIPKIDDIYNKYSQGNIKAKLTVYATVCKPKDVPNYHFIEWAPPKIGTLAEGLLINYYFYFPAMESSEHKREGDWSGISIFFKEFPDLTRLSQRMPKLTCYFRKIGDYLDATTDGFREWQKVTKVKDQQTGLETHPVVYISLGRHNCYYQPSDTTIPLTPHWKPTPDAEKVEEGKYSYLSGDIVGTLEWDPYSLVYIFMPWTMLFEECGLTCEFDSPGISGYQDSSDKVGKDGYGGAPANAQTGTSPGSDDYPSGPPPKGSPQFVKLNVTYVDLSDAAVKANWGFKGSWGAAEFETYSWEYEGNTFSNQWGYFKGFARPNLAPWFLWNLYWDPVFGSVGGTGYMP